MGVFVGIIAGFVGAVIFNKYYNYRKLPDALSFFNGKRFVPFVVIGWSVLISLVLAIIWPVVQTGINNFGIWIADVRGYRTDFGTIRLRYARASAVAVRSAPYADDSDELHFFGWNLHHFDRRCCRFSSVRSRSALVGLGQRFGELEQHRAIQQPTIVALLNAFTPARFKVGQMIGAAGSLMGLAYAMYRNVDVDKRPKYKSMFFSAAIAVFLTGVTEPLEYMFMFAAPLLYGVYAVLQGAAFAMADIISLRVHSFGTLEFLTRIPMSLKAGLWLDVVNYIWVTLAFAVIMYFVANFMIKRFKFATPGRLGNYTDLDGEAEEAAPATATPEGNAGASDNDKLVWNIIDAFGGQENITEVDACMTRLRVTVKDETQVAEDKKWSTLGARGVIRKGKGIQVVYGPPSRCPKI